MRGGTAVVQDPADATINAMPLNALQYTEADYTVPATEIGTLLRRVVGEPAVDAAPPAPEEDKRTRREISIAEGTNAMEEGVMQFGMLSPFTCPECRGVLTQLKDGRIVRYRCHTGHGHALTRETLLDSILEKAEDSLYDAVRALDETVMLLRQMAAQAQREGNAGTAARLLARAREAEARSLPVRGAAKANEESSKTSKSAPQHGDPDSDIRIRLCPHDVGILYRNACCFHRRSGQVSALKR